MRLVGSLEMKACCAFSPAQHRVGFGFLAPVSLFGSCESVRGDEGMGWITRYGTAPKNSLYCTARYHIHMDIR